MLKSILSVLGKRSFAIAAPCPGGLDAGGAAKEKPWGPAAHFIGKRIANLTKPKPSQDLAGLFCGVPSRGNTFSGVAGFRTPDFPNNGGGVDALALVVVGNGCFNGLFRQNGTVDLCRRQTIQSFYYRLIAQFIGRRQWTGP